MSVNNLVNDTSFRGLKKDLNVDANRIDDVNNNSLLYNLFSLNDK